MQKPALAVRSWQERGYPIEIAPVKAATRQELLRAHDARYVDGVLSGKIANGFGTRDLDIARSLPFTSGAMVAAAFTAIVAPSSSCAGLIACAPVSGFHHASWDRAHGFCTFNGLMVAALSVLQHPSVRVGILDYDMHYGDGTVDILDRLPSLTRDRIEHRTFGGDIMAAQSRMQGNAEERALAADSVMSIPKTLAEWKRRGVGLVLYQAGADPHVRDPFGGVLTSDQLMHRDQLVFSTCKALQLPCAWCLAGGYQEDTSKEDLYERIRPVLDLHDATMRACVDVYCGDEEP
jgi:acetoin utilization deacetylase AcuC-like enzyme